MNRSACWRCEILVDAFEDAARRTEHASLWRRFWVRWPHMQRYLRHLWSSEHVT